MTKIKGIIFDLDGTILDTIYDIADSANSVLEKLGCNTHSYKEYEKFLGNGFKNLMKKSLPEGTDEATLNIALKLFTNEYEKNYMNKTKPFDYIENVLKALQEKDVKMAVNSNKKDIFTKNLVNKFFHDINFVRVYGDREGIKRKPDPETSLEIAEAMQLSPKEIIYIGDSEVDVMTAKNANMKSGVVSWGYRDINELKKYDVDCIFYEPRDILKIIE
jgi:phosphoglycolate phosphatase